MRFLKNLFKKKGEEVVRRNNVDGLHVIYSELANTINDLIPIEWDKIYFYSELTYDDGYDSVSVCFYYRDKKGVIHPGLNIDDKYPELRKQFEIKIEELQALSLSVGQQLKICSPKEEKYIMFTLILEEDFYCTSKIEYEIEDVDEYQRRLNWEETYLK